MPQGSVLCLVYDASCGKPGELEGAILSREALLQVWAAFFLSNAILPGCMVYTALTSTIEWSGMHYRKTQGRIVRVNAPIAFSEA